MNDTEPHQDRGALLNEPCRYCHEVGGVYFVLDDSPWGKSQPQVVGCSRCGATWTADGPLA
jgi:hypothetical protein